MAFNSDEYTETNGTMEEVSKKIRSAHAQKYGGKKNLADMEKRMRNLYERKTDPSDPNRPTFEAWKASLQAPEELPEGAGVDETEEPAEVEEQEVPGNYHENDPEVMEDGAPEPPAPDELTDQELNRDPLELLGEDEQKEYMEEMMARDGNEYADQEDDPYKQIEKSNSSLSIAAKAMRARAEAPPEE